MARLKDFRKYLEERRAFLVRAEAGLTTLQAKYEDFFAEVTRVRESELRQLIDLTLTDRSSLPGDFNAEIDRVAPEIERELDEKIADLRAQRKELIDQADAIRATSLRAEKRIRGRNRRLDREEEELKARTAELLENIEEYNRRIRSLGSGFGFFSNFFKLRELARRQEILEEEHADVAARIEALRTKWQIEEGRHLEREKQRKIEWTELERKGAALSATIEALETRRTEVVVRMTLERILEGRRPNLSDAAEGDPPCPRCGMPNPRDAHFCHICAKRLGEDRKDFEGSLEEIAEIDLHHRRFSEGMEACQSIIGLVRGLISGVDAFCKSIDDMIESEDKYPLPKLEIDVPQSCRAFGAEIDRLSSFANQDYSLHPSLFARRFDEYFGKIFTEEKIQAFFETMGEELSARAGEQWD